MAVKLAMFTKNSKAALLPQNINAMKYPRSPAAIQVDLVAMNMMERMVW